MDRLPTVFHETFVLSRPSINAILSVLPTSLTNNDFKSRSRREEFFREKTHLGTSYIRSMPEYAKGCGLINFNYSLSLFGTYALKKDPMLDNVNTQWLMHYHLCAPQGPGSVFWYELVYKYFRSGDEFTKKDIEAGISEIYLREQGKTLAHDSCTNTANIFLETYKRSDALGALGILEQIDADRYRVAEVDPPPLWVVAAAFLDFWQAHFSNQVTINLSTITVESPLASLLMMSRSRLDRLLGEMREAGIVELFRAAPPYQIALLDANLETVLQRIYQNE